MSTATTAADLADKLNARRSGNGWAAKCPAHDDRNASLSISHGDDGKLLLHCHAGCRFQEILAAAGVESTKRDAQPPRRSETRKRIAATYPYTNAAGELLYEVVRFEPKDFRPRLPDGTYGLNGTARVLYRLPDLCNIGEDTFVYLVEGEKDADRLTAEGMVATTTAGGAKGAEKTPLDPLHNRHVVIIPDNDDAGRDFAQGIAARLHGKAASVRVVELPGVPGKGDASDYLDAGNDPEDLDRLAANTPGWEPGAERGGSVDADSTAKVAKQEQQATEGTNAADDATPANTKSTTRRMLDPSDPLPSARTLVKHTWQAGGRRTIHHYRGAFTAWTGSHYPEVRDELIRSVAYSLAERAVYIDESGKPAPFKPTKNKITNMVDALKAITIIPDDVRPPAWLDATADDPDPANIVALRNGLLDLATGTLHDHDPRFFNAHALDFDYEPDAGAPEHWLQFLHDLWPDDPEAISTLREWFGYCLTPDTTQQKIALLVGPKRSGKGTIGRILTAMLGVHNVVAPTLASMSQNFGMAPLIGKPLAIVSDARLGGRADQATIAERLLSISGEDTITIDRKNREAWSGKLPTRFMILSNELPRIGDTSGALASRFVTLTLENSFYGAEDTGLTDRLLGELAQIFNWSVEGWRDLQERGAFVEPASSRDAVAELQDLGSPLGAFVRERCTVAPDCSVDTKVMFNAWRDWCSQEGRDHPGTAASFGRDLRAVVPGLKVQSHRSGGIRWRSYEGITLDS